MKTLRVLIVDDVKADVDYATAMLEQKGHTVLVAENGRQGIEIAEKEHPDVILMDVVMPELNGFQATRQLSRNEQTRDIPVIVVSGKNQETDKIWAMKQGAKAYLTKQLNKNSLFGALESVTS